MPLGWTAMRNRYIKRHPICEHPGCTAEAAAVDHRLNRARGGTDDDANLQSLCTEHHKAKTQHESNLRW